MRTRLITAALAAALSLTGISIAAPTAAAASTAYRLNHHTTSEGSTVVRWNPCQKAITYRVNVAGLPTKAAKRSAVRVTRASVARVARATGISFAYRGRTAVVPRSRNIATQKVAEIVIAFVKPRQTDYSLAGSTAGRGGWRATYGTRANGTYALAITRGFVVIDQPQTRAWPNGAHRGGVTRANLISHELGHVVGLDHVHDSRQLMHHTLHRRSPTGFAAGDRAGLRRVGRPAGCINATWATRDLN